MGWLVYCILEVYHALSLPEHTGAVSSQVQQSCGLHLAMPRIDKQVHLAVHVVIQVLGVEYLVFMARFPREAPGEMSGEAIQPYSPQATIRR